MNKDAISKEIKKKNGFEFLISFPLDTIPSTFKAIWRNKRRSFAMLAGILLATTLLSGIILYNDELKQDNYLSMVQGYPFELRFDIMGDESEAALHELSNMIAEDERVEDTTVIGTVNSNLQTNWFWIEVFSDEAIASSNPVGQFATPYFIENDFFEGAIGDKLYAMEYDGSTELEDGSVIISEQLARELGIKIGEKVPLINATQQIWIGDVSSLNEGYLANLTLIGTYKADLWEEDIVISESPLMGQNVFMHMDSLELESMDAIENGMRDNGNFYVAVKMDIKQFTVNEPSVFLDELEAFTNQMTKKTTYDILGTNVIAGSVIGFQIFSIFITVLYVLLSVPVIILSVYLLNFGLEMSLEERRRLIAIKKVAGANSKQIFAELRNETILLLIFGSFIGYGLGIFSAWGISSATGYMKLSFGSFNEATSSFGDYLYFNLAAFLWPFISTSVLLIARTYKMGRSFIESEVTEGVQRREVKEQSFFRKNKIDVLMFLVGLGGIGLVIIDIFRLPVAVGMLTEVLVYAFAPFFFWIGGSSVGSRLVKLVPLKLEGSFLRLPMFKDVKRVIKSGLKRRGDMDRLALIIILTLSIAALATIQGTTEEFQAERNVEWSIGADWLIQTNNAGDHRDKIMSIDHFTDTVGITGSYARVLSSGVMVYAIDNHNELQNFNNGNPVINWQRDNFERYTAHEALQMLEDNPMGVFVNQDQLTTLDTSIGGTFELRVPVAGSTSGLTEKIDDIKVLGIVNQLPSGISWGLFASEDLLQKIRAVASNQSIDAFEGVPLNASNYFASDDLGEDKDLEAIKQMQIELDDTDGITAHQSLYYEKSKIDTAAQGYGISGLLSLDFIISLAASLISAFSFSAILMERRKQEFAILRAIGAKKRHIYKLALGENTLMMLTASLWGIFLGVGIAYLFNGVFVFVSFMVGGGGSFERLVVVPGLELLIICVITIIGMLGATLLSIRSAANQDLALGIKGV